MHRAPGSFSRGSVAVQGPNPHLTGNPGVNCIIIFYTVPRKELLFLISTVSAAKLEEKTRLGCLAFPKIE
jgi:hypothetical protein